MNEQYQTLKEILESRNSFVLTTHVNPDGDAIGSEAALGRFLADQGKSVHIINQSTTPDHLRFLEKIHPVQTYSSSLDRTIEQSDCIIVLDTNSPRRFSSLADAVQRANGFKICIDHHPEAEPFADLTIVDTDVPATCELLYRILTFIDPPGITRPVADALYTGIMTDTASFRFPKTDAETHSIISELLSKGVDPYKIYQHVFEEGPLNKLWLLGKALESIRLSAEGRIAAMVLPRSVFAETGTTEADVDNFTSYVLSVKDVQVGLVFVELDAGTKVSFRSKGDIAVNELAQRFHGGGHRNAAGARLNHLPFDEAINTVIDATTRFIGPKGEA